MVRGSEHEAASRARDASRQSIWVEIDPDAKSFERVGGADPSAHGAIAMLGDPHAGGGGHQGRGGGYIIGSGAVAAGARGVEKVGAEIERTGAFEQRPRSAGQFRGGLAFHLERDQKPSDEHVGGYVVENLAERVFRRRRVERPAAQRLLESVAQIAHPATPARKLRKRSLPSRVPIDSGWNCTPSIRRSRCRKPMISPSAVRALTSRHPGTVSGATNSE